MRKILRIVFNNFQYKVAAIFIACIFWYLVHGEEILEINRKIQITIHIPDGLVVKGDRTRIKDVTISGPRVLLGDFPTTPIEAIVTLPTANPGRYRYRIDKEHIPGWNNRMKLIVHDAYITVIMDYPLSKELPVKENLVGTPADGLAIEKAEIFPERVIVSGLKEEIDKLHYVGTDTIDINNLSTTDTRMVRLIGRPDFDLKFSQDEVSVKLKVGEQRINKKFYGIPIELEGTRQPVKIRAPTVSVVIQGSRSVMQGIKRTLFAAYVDVRGLTIGLHERRVYVRIPPDTTLVEVIPESTQIEILG